MTISLKLLEQLRVGTPVVIGRQINGILQLGHVERFYFDSHQQKNFVVVKGMNDHSLDFDDLIFHQGVLFHKEIWNERVILKNPFYGDYMLQVKSSGESSR